MLASRRSMQLQWLYVSLLVLAASVYCQQGCVNMNPDPPASGCVPLEHSTVSSVDGCTNFYSHTSFPNNYTMNLQNAETGLRFNRPFFAEFDCSPYAHVYTCLALFPLCDEDTQQVLPPCASLCDLVLASCQARIGGTSDPFCLLMQCSRYPEKDSGQCISEDHPLIRQQGPPSPEVTMPTEPTTTANASESDNITACPHPNRSFFQDSTKRFATGWLIVWALACFISTTLTLLTFCLDPSRFQYPWRPVIYLALSFNIHSLAYFLSLAIGERLITCPSGEFVQTSISWSWAHTPCIIVFALLYYTMMAAFLWWLILTFTWFLTSAFTWSSEAVAQLAPFYHVVAWVIPLLLTIALLAARAIGADELTSTCFVVRDESTKSFLALLLGIIIPLILLLVLGMCFLVIGLISILRIRSFMHDKGKEKETNILEKLIIRIGIFVTVYILPASVVIGCFIYELVSRHKWRPHSPLPDYECTDCVSPNPVVFMVRIFMFLIIGALTGVWIWSQKTLLSWRQLPSRLRNCCCSNRHNTDSPAAENALSIDLSINGRPQSGSFSQAGSYTS